MKGLINIKNKDGESFKWCHIKFINSTNSRPERINKKIKRNCENFGLQRYKFSYEGQRL